MRLAPNSVITGLVTSAVTFTDLTTAVAAFNAVLDEVAAESPIVSTLPLDDLLCPGGEPIGEFDGELIRSDGVHLTEPGTQLVWTWLDAQLRAMDLTSL